MGRGIVGTTAAVDTLASNPWLGGSVLTIGLGFMVWLVRMFMQSDGRWQRLSDVQQQQLDAALKRATEAERRAITAEGKVHELRSELEQLRAEVARRNDGRS